MIQLLCCCLQVQKKKKTGTTKLALIRNSYVKLFRSFHLSWCRENDFDLEIVMILAFFRVFQQSARRWWQSVAKALAKLLVAITLLISTRLNDNVHAWLFTIWHWFLLSFSSRLLPRNKFWVEIVYCRRNGIQTANKLPFFMLTFHWFRKIHVCLCVWKWNSWLMIVN